MCFGFGQAANGLNAVIRNFHPRSGSCSEVGKAIRTIVGGIIAAAMIRGVFADLPRRVQGRTRKGKSSFAHGVKSAPEPWLAVVAPSGQPVVAEHSARKSTRRPASGRGDSAAATGCQPSRNAAATRSHSARSAAGVRSPYESRYSPISCSSADQAALSTSSKAAIVSSVTSVP